MGYYANGSGTIDFGRILTECENTRVCELLSGCFDAYEWYGSYSCSYDGKYYGYEVENVLRAVAKVAPIKDGCIEFTGEDNCVWRFVYKNGAWNEQNGRIVYDDGRFGEVSWCRDDIIEALKENPDVTNVTDTLVDEILCECMANTHFTDPMIEAGWAVINNTIYSVLSKQNP